MECTLGHRNQERMGRLQDINLNGDFNGRNNLSFSHAFQAELIMLPIERFEVTFRDGSQLKDEGVRQILVDKETGVNYLCWKSGYGAAITPLLDSEGKVIVTK